MQFVKWLGLLWVRREEPAEGLSGQVHLAGQTQVGPLN